MAVHFGRIRDYEERLPATAAFVAEIAEDHLSFYSTLKHRIYAAANIQEYWILEMESRQLCVFRHPQPSKTGPSSYTTSFVVEESGSVHPLFAPHITVKVAEVLPSKR